MPQVLGKEVGPIGYGLMGFTWRPEPTPTDKAIEALKTALESGLTLWNGAEFYGTPECNSMTLLKAYFTKYPEDADRVTLFIKGGLDLTTFAPDGSAEATRRSLDNVIAGLGGLKKLDGWAPGRRDAKVPLEVTCSVVQKEYIDTGKLGCFYVSECRAETIREASKYVKVGACEVELSMFSPDILTNGVTDACAEFDIPIMAYSPMGRGILAGRFKNVSDVQILGRIASFPRFQPGNFENNLQLVKQIEGIASAKGCTSGQLAIAWVRKHSKRPGLPTIVPIPGATTPSRVTENAQVIDITDEEFQQLNEIASSFEASGTRYPEHAHTET